MLCPSFNVFGTFFPSWMLCAMLGILLAVILRQIAIRLKLDRVIKPAILVYPSIGICVTFVIWLHWFGR